MGTGRERTGLPREQCRSKRIRTVSDSFSERVLRSVCLFQTHLTGLFALCLLLFILTVASLLVLERGTPGYAVSLLNLVGTVFFGVVSGSLALLCNRRG